MKKIFFDTETTGFDVKTIDRVIEVALIEYDANGDKTGREFHRYINPEGKKVGSSFEIHGLSDDFLLDKPTFKEVLPELIEFIRDGDLVAHNAMFDREALEAEFKRSSSTVSFGETIHSLQDTWIISKKLNKQKGFKHTLDNLMAHYGVDSSSRVKHGAYIDTELLANVFYKMTENLITQDLEGLASKERSPIIYLADVDKLVKVSVLPEEAEANQKYLSKLPKPKVQPSEPGQSPALKM